MYCFSFFYFMPSVQLCPYSVASTAKHATCMKNCQTERITRGSCVPHCRELIGGPACLPPAVPALILWNSMLSKLCFFSLAVQLMSLIQSKHKIRAPLPLSHRSFSRIAAHNRLIFLLSRVNATTVLDCENVCLRLLKWP